MAQIHIQWLIVFNDDNIIGISPVFLKKEFFSLKKGGKAFSGEN